LLTRTGASLSFEKIDKKKSIITKSQKSKAQQHFNNFSFSLPSMEEFQVHDKITKIIFYLLKKKSHTFCLLFFLLFFENFTTLTKS